MKYKMLSYLVPFFLFAAGLHAQTHPGEIEVSAESTVPFFQNDRGLGFELKYLAGVSRSGQWTLAIGVAGLKTKGGVEERPVHTRLVPVLAGYRQNFSRAFLEGQIGFGELGGKIQAGGDFIRPSVGALFGGLRAGYRAKRMDVGLHFVTVHGVESASAGIWHDRNSHYTGSYAGYRFNVSKR